MHYLKFPHGGVPNWMSYFPFTNSLLKIRLPGISWATIKFRIQSVETLDKNC